MSFDLGSFIGPGTILGGVGVGLGIAALLDKGGKRSITAESLGGDQAKITALQAELDANKESQAKVDEVHAYARKLEEKIQQLESTSDSADAQLRVKVLEKQLSEKADLESKLAVALQQLEDYKAKADMFDTVVGSEPVLPAAQAEPTPVAAKKKEKPAEESIAAVASAAEKDVPEMKVVETENPISGVASPVGATALAVEVRPALRVESNSIVEAKDPLEKIEGIGQVYQTKLYEAGIRTFAQLAAASPSRITEIVEPQNWQTIDIMKWRREAALYAAGEKA